VARPRCTGPRPTREVVDVRHDGRECGGPLGRRDAESLKRLGAASPFEEAGQLVMEGLVAQASLRFDAVAHDAADWDVRGVATVRRGYGRDAHLDVRLLALRRPWFGHLLHRVARLETL